MNEKSTFIHRTLFALAWAVAFVALLGRIDDDTPPLAGIAVVVGWPTVYCWVQYFIFNRRLE